MLRHYSSLLLLISHCALFTSTLFTFLLAEEVKRRLSTSGEEGGRIYRDWKSVIEFFEQKEPTWATRQLWQPGSGRRSGNCWIRQIWHWLTFNQIIINSFHDTLFGLCKRFCNPDLSNLFDIMLILGEFPPQAQLLEKLSRPEEKTGLFVRY
jgi:hypothetical protein